MVKAKPIFPALLVTVHLVSSANAASLTPLGNLHGFASGSQASDISADGSVVVGRSYPEAFRWTRSTGMVGIGGFPGGFPFSFAAAISADGSVIVGMANAGPATIPFSLE